MPIFGPFKQVKSKMPKRNPLLRCIIVLLLTLSNGINAQGVVLNYLFPKTPTENWFIPDLGKNSGSYEVSVGTHIWSDHFDFRNLRARLSMNLGPGFRGHMQWRSNREFSGIDRIEPFLDEGFLEWFSFYKNDYIHYSRSLKVGRLRYLRFPTPDIISMFDLPPGLEDLQSGSLSWFQGISMTTEYVLPVGLGYHSTMLYWLDTEQNGLEKPENYLFYRARLGWWEIEARLGRLQRRTKPRFRGSPGQSIYSGVRLGDYRVGLFYEDIDEEPIRTGILVEFAPSPVTEMAGNVGLDFTRNPMGFGIQVPISRGSFGFLDTPPAGTTLVGVVEAERTITYFENGQGRNFYEHIVSHEGIVSGDDLHIVITEQPWYLRIESLVSPHNKFKNWDDFVQWEKTRQGPAQLAQRVVYRYYR